MRAKLFSFVVLLSVAVIPCSLYAQIAEINPYAGFYWPGNDFQNNQLLGVRGGYYITPSFEIGGNYSWSNHFQPNNSNAPSALAGALGFPQPRVRANIWEAEFTYNFGSQSMFGSSIKPYVVVGAGGLTTRVGGDGQFVLSMRPELLPFGPGSATTLIASNVISNDTFFSISYGGGLKAQRLWGPMGVFGDFRGRSIPNFFNGSFNWPEVSAGLTFSWGER
jgi:hypothetical protein